MKLLFIADDGEALPEPYGPGVSEETEAITTFPGVVGDAAVKAVFDHCKGLDVPHKTFYRKVVEEVSE